MRSKTQVREEQDAIERFGKADSNANREAIQASKATKRERDDEELQTLIAAYGEDVRKLTEQDRNSLLSASRDDSFDFETFERIQKKMEKQATVGAPASPAPSEAPGLPHTVHTRLDPPQTPHTTNWACSACTYASNPPLYLTCEMCNQPRDGKGV